MGLRSKENKTTVPADQKETAAEEKVEVEAEVKEEAKPEKAVALKKQAAVPASVEGAAPTLMSLRNAMNGEEFGTNLTRLVPASGSVKVAGTPKVLGKFVDVQLVSSSDRWFITPVADPKDKDAKKFCRPSYDGKTIPSRDGEAQTIEEYTNSVEEYDEFDVKKYLDLYVLVIRAGDPDMQEIVEAFDLIQVSVSPTAAPMYRTFEKLGKLRVMRGLSKAETQNCFRITATAKSNDSSDWTVFEFNPIPLNDLEGYVPVDLSE